MDAAISFSLCHSPKTLLPERPCDYHRCVDRVNDRIADRTQQHAAQATAAVATDDDKLSRFRLLDERSARVIKCDDSVHLDIGVALSPARQIFGEAPLRFRPPVK